jgi:hypothetical protein
LNIENNIDKFLNTMTDGNKKIIPKDILIGIVIINWLGLTQYCQNNLLKCVSSYYYGIYLLNILKNLINKINKINGIYC